MTSASIERSIHRDLTQVMRWLVSVAVRCGVYEFAVRDDDATSRA